MQGGLNRPAREQRARRRAELQVQAARRAARPLLVGATLETERLRCEPRPSLYEPAEGRSQAS